MSFEVIYGPDNHYDRVLDFGQVLNGPNHNNMVIVPAKMTRARKLHAARLASFFGTRHNLAYVDDDSILSMWDYSQVAEYRNVTVRKVTITNLVTGERSKHWDIVSDSASWQVELDNLVMNSL